MPLRHLPPTVSPARLKTSGEIIEQFDTGEIFIAACSEMQKVRTQSELLANIDAPVLILGESGTGKEVTARLIHRLSSRSQRRFLKVNCAALPAELLESELFGYEPGASAGAMRTRPGKFELGSLGTILLGEVEEMPANLQARLVHVLQDQQFLRLGGENTTAVDVRILAATRVNVHQAIAKRKFREDLYYRLREFTITLPPLRKRQEEIPLLLRHFMGRMASPYSRPTIRLSAALIEACLRYPWPGNLTELENFVKRHLVTGNEATAIAELRANWRPSQISVDESSRPTAVHLKSVPVDGTVQGARVKASLRALKDEAEVNAIARALEETRWNRKQAARLLNISYRGLLYKIRQHGITRLPDSGSTTYVRDGDVT